MTDFVKNPLNENEAPTVYRGFYEDTPENAAVRIEEGVVEEEDAVWVGRSGLVWFESNFKVKLFKALSSPAGFSFISKSASLSKPTSDKSYKFKTLL